MQDATIKNVVLFSSRHTAVGKFRSWNVKCNKNGGFVIVTTSFYFSSIPPLNYKFLDLRLNRIFWGIGSTGVLISP